MSSYIIHAHIDISTQNNNMINSNLYMFFPYYDYLLWLYNIIHKITYAIIPIYGKTITNVFILNLLI